MLNTMQSDAETSWQPAGPRPAGAGTAGASGWRIDTILATPAQQLFASGDLDEARAMVGRVMRR